AEDGIRDFHVTGVQTCALPIFTDDELRPYVLGAIRRYFSDDEWSRLTDVWTDLGTAAEPPWRAGLRIQPKATENLEAVTSSFLKIGRASCRERVGMAVAAR